MKFIAATLFFWTICFNCYGQQVTGRFTISGKVFNKQEHITLTTVKVILMDIETGKTSGSTYADQSGNFNFSQLSNGKYKLQFCDRYSFTYDTTVIINNRSIKKLRYFIDLRCETYSKAVAEKDIANGHPRLLLSTGAGVPDYFGDDTMEYHNQNVFQKKYGIEYDNFGCIIDDTYSCITSYNRTVFNYLDAAFGKSWRKEVWKEVYGFSQ
jgi:hypothetical protein